MRNAFYTARGWLTRYALACGYIHKQSRRDGQEVLLSLVNADLPLYLVARYDGPQRTFESYSHDLRTARHMFHMAMGQPLQWRWESNPDVNRAVIT